MMMEKHNEHCKSIVDDMMSYYNGEVFLDDEQEEQASLFDYFSDALDIEYLINSDRTFKAVRVLVAFGGPNIYVDTITGKVSLYWWNEEGEAWIPSELCEAINETFEELYNC